MSRNAVVLVLVCLVLGMWSGSLQAQVEAPTTAPPPHDMLKNRYISIVPGNELLGGFDIRVTLKTTEVNSVPDALPDFWASEPDEKCRSWLWTTQPESPPDWSECPVVHVTGCAVIPTSTFDVVVLDGDNESAPLETRTIFRPLQNRWWGDTVGYFTGTEWTGPNRHTNVDDFVAIIKTFQNPDRLPGCNTPPCNAAHCSRVDVEPNLPPTSPNGCVCISDVFAIILAYQGNEYPGPDLLQCP